ncbi:MAG: RING finger protein [Firmicutes bacterium]|nr:RING finger protein [Bacillota bacterium]
MFKYEGAKCPVCHAYLMEDDDIVVCPECGAPHHRECWKSIGHCGCEQLHAEGKTWAMPAKEDPAPDAQGVKKLCPACHAPNAPDALFCSRCGSPMQQEAPFSGGAYPGAPGGQPGQQGGPMPYGGFQPMVIDPLGGVAPDEEIDGVQAKDLALVVGQNSAYYLPRFREISKGNHRFFPNFTAFLFNVPWMFFRRMVWPAIAVLLLELALNIPNAWLMVRVLTDANFSSASISAQFQNVTYLCSMAQFALNFVICIFANKFYMKQCVRMAKELRENSADDESFAEQAKKRGGVKPVAIYICLGLAMLYYLVYSFFVFRGMGA